MYVNFGISCFRRLNLRCQGFCCIITLPYTFSKENLMFSYTFLQVKECSAACWDMCLCECLLIAELHPTNRQNFPGIVTDLASCPLFTDTNIIINEDIRNGCVQATKSGGFLRYWWRAWKVSDVIGCLRIYVIASSFGLLLMTSQWAICTPPVAGQVQI